MARQAGFQSPDYTRPCTIFYITRLRATPSDLFFLIALALVASFGTNLLIPTLQRRLQLNNHTLMIIGTLVSVLPSGYGAIWTLLGSRGAFVSRPVFLAAYVVARAGSILRATCSSALYAQLIPVVRPASCTAPWIADGRTATS